VVPGRSSASGAIVQANPRALADLLTLENILLNPNSGTPLDWCFDDTFTSPVDIRPLVLAKTGFQVTPTNVPGRSP
jgi:hypothetical protein